MAGNVLLDTNGWIPLLNSSELLHRQATDIWLELGRRGYRITLTDWIIAETGNGLARSSTKSRFAESVKRFFQSGAVDLVMIDHPLIAQALELYRGYADKNWGLVDCASFVVMRQHGITEAFTSDKHFEQAGFRCLLSMAE